MAAETFSPEQESALREDCAKIISRYPNARSAVMPMLHLMQSVDGYVSARGIALCADVLGTTRAEVSAVATFYSQYKRHPVGDYLVGVCTNALCAILGGDTIWDDLSDYLDTGTNETTEDGTITLERLECNAACDYAPVVMVNWEFFDNQTPTSTRDLVDKIQAGETVTPTRGSNAVSKFKDTSRLLAGFEDGKVDEGVSTGQAGLRGLTLAREHNWTAPRPEASGAIDPGKAEYEGTVRVGEAGSSAAHQADEGKASDATSGGDK